MQASADTLTIDNGDRITGTLVGIVGGNVTFTTEYAGTLVVAQASVASIESDAEFELIDQTGSVSAQQLDTASDVAAIRTAKQSFVTGVAFAQEWSNRLDVASAVSTGNSDTRVHSVLLESVYKRGKTEHTVNVAVFNEEADGITTKEQLDIDYGLKWFYADDWYAAGNGEYFQDDLKDIDRRITLGVGIGHQFWDETFGSLSAEAGISQVYQESLGTDESDPAFRWALDYKKFLLGKRMEIFHSHELLTILASGRGEVIDSSTGVRYALSDRFSVSARADIQHETEPPVGTDKTDVTYLLGAGLTF